MAEIQARSCTEADVRLAIELARDGDMILIPEGRLMLDEPLHIDKDNLTIFGQGAGVHIGVREQDHIVWRNKDQSNG